MDMKTITKVEDYRKCINEVKETGNPVTVKNNMSVEENEKLTNTDLKGIDIIVSEECDEIKPL